MAELKYKTGNLNNLTPHQIDDLVNTTMEYLIGKGKFTNLLSDLNDYVAVRELMARHKKTFEGGMDWTFNVAITANNTGNGTAKTTKLFGTDSSTRVDAIKKGKVSPRYITANYVYDTREPALNSGSMVQRIDYVNEQMNLMYQSYYNLKEGLFWGEPADMETDPAGIKYWILPATSDTGMGSFEPVNPTGGARAGIDSTKNPRWANWSARYAAVSKDDLVKKMRYAARKTTFRSPLTVGEPKLGSGRGIYVGIDTLTELEDLLEKQNMNLGNDLAAKDGKTLFKGNPVYHVPYLDADATAPLYMIDWSTLQLGILAGWDKKVSKPMPVADMHTVRQVFLDSTCNFVCTNLRNQAVLSKAAA